MAIPELELNAISWQSLSLLLSVWSTWPGNAFVLIFRFLFPWGLGSIPSVQGVICDMNPGPICSGSIKACHYFDLIYDISMLLSSEFVPAFEN
jgi:hypothetical protein